MNSIWLSIHILIIIMNVPLNPSKNLLAQDNSKIKNEVSQLFTRGDLKWNTGGTS